MYACPLGSMPRLPAGLPSMGIGQRWRGGGRGGDAISNGDDNKRGGERRGQRDWLSYLRITKSIRPHQTIAGFSPNLSRKIGLRSAVMQVADSRSVKGNLYH